LKNEADLLVSYAEREAVRSRTQFMATLAEIRRRTDPRVIATEAAEKMMGRANHMVETTTTAVRARPTLALGGLAVFLVALGLRFWLTRRKEE
jgi:hypothetical protein